MDHFIYKTTNLINNKIYIGHRSCDNLYKDSYLGSNKELLMDIKLYKKYNFKREILEVCSSQEELSNKEKYWITKFNSINFGYNKHLKGTGQKLNFKHSEETKRNYSINNKGKLAGDKNPMYGMSGELNPMYGVHRFGNESPHYGKTHSLESKKKMSESHKKNSKGEDNPFYGKKHTDKTKLIISLKSKERFSLYGSPLKGRIISEEIKLKYKISWINRKILICPFCKKESKNAANMYRYHFDNCKLNKINK